MVKSSFVLVTALGMMTACTSRQTQTNLPAPGGQQTGQNQTGQQTGPNGANNGAQNGNGQNNGQNGSANGDTGNQLGASIPITLDAKELQQKYALDTANLTYHFKYQTSDTTGAIAFTADKATITFNGLKPNEASDLLLEVLQAGTVKLRGEQKALTLQPGSQTIQLTLKAVDGKGGDLTIDVTVEQPGTGSTNTNTNTNTGGNTATNTNTGGNTATNTNTGGNTATNTNTNTGSNTATNTNTNTNSGGNTATSTATTPNTGGGTGTGPSFAKDITPILNTYCVECHHQNAQFPDLTVPPEAGVVDLMVADIKSGKMPKAPRDPMPASEMQKIIDWKNAGRQP